MSRRFDLTQPDVSELLRWVQDGVVTRSQLLEFGATPEDMRRMVRRRELTRVVPGVFVNHTGRLSREQREWVAVLAAWPAALTRESVLPDPPYRVVHIAVAHGRRLKVPGWIRVHRTSDFDLRADLSRRPPEVAIEHALIDVMSSRIAEDDVPSAFAALAQAAHTRRTGPDRILRALAERRRVAHRSIIERLLTDLRDGACSVLERGYLHRVERAHGLPRAHRQRQSLATGRRTDKDVIYDEYGVIVELDGRAHHDTPRAWDDDARRDLAELATIDAVTARVTYGLVFREACRTAGWIATILRRNGWTGQIHPCPRCRSA